MRIVIRILETKRDRDRDETRPRNHIDDRDGEDDITYKVKIEAPTFDGAITLGFSSTSHQTWVTTLSVTGRKA